MEHAVITQKSQDIKKTRCSEVNWQTIFYREMIEIITCFGLDYQQRREYEKNSLILNHYEHVSSRFEAQMYTSISKISQTKKLE